MTGRLVGSAALLVAFVACRLGSELFVDATVPRQAFRNLAVVPASGSMFDHRIAARVWSNLRTAGVSVVDPASLTPVRELNTAAVCRQAAAVDYQAVVLVDWNELTLVDCATQLTAFRVAGSDMNAPGVDRLTQALVRYLRGESLR